MNILVITAYPPVLQMHGGGVRMYHNIRILSSRHRVKVISFVESDEDRQRLEMVRSICESVTAVPRIPDFRPHWLSILPFLVREFSTPGMYRAIDDVFRTERVDVLQCEYLQTAQFRRRGIPAVITLHESLSWNAHNAFTREVDALEKLRLFYRWMQTMRYEVMQTRAFDRTVTMTGEDAAYLKSYSPKANIRAVPIGVDPSHFQPFAEDIRRPEEVLFVGNFRHFPNVEAAKFILGNLVPRFPEIRFVFSGTWVSPDLLQYSGTANVSWAGYVPDTRDLHRRPNTVVLAPLFSGTGQRVKLLEAFAMACPVITTTTGAMGFPIQSGREALIANTVEEFSAALSLLLGSVERRREIGEAARRMILSRFSWDHLAGDFLSVVEEAVATR